MDAVISPIRSSSPSPSTRLFAKMSLSALQPTPSVQVHRSSSNANGKEASFLTFNYVNKHARVRVSPTPLDLSAFDGKADFLTVANLQGWFAAITRSQDGNIQLSCSPLSHLHSTFATKPIAGVDEIEFTPQRTVTISPATPNILTLACNDTRLLIGSTQGPIAVYDCSQLFTAGTNDISPVHTFSGSQPCEQIVPNPGDIPELVAALRQGDNSVELLNVQTGQVVGGWKSSGTPDTTPSSLTWSPRGKQLAIGLQSGDIVTFSPSSTDSPKSLISKPPAAGDKRVVATTWLANPTFHTVYSPVGQVTAKTPQDHYVINFDSKSNSASDVAMSAPYYPFPGLRLPGTFVLTLRNWDPLKFLLVIGDTTSSDIGSIGCFADDSWCNLTLDEAFTPSLPLDKNMEDTILLGLELDLTAKDPYDHTSEAGEKIQVPPPPIAYAYLNDGTLLAWHVVNSNGPAYPGMVNASASADAPMSMTPSTSMIGSAETKPAASPAFGSTNSGFSAFGQAAKQSAFGQSGFGQPAQNPPSTFGSSTSSGFAAFAQPGNQPAFGQSSFGQSSTTPSTFGQSPTSPPAFGQSSASPTAFGQSPTSPPAFGQSSASPPAFGQSSFGQSSFGQSSTQSAFGQSSFGQSSQPSVFGSGFGNSTFGKPPVSSAFGSNPTSSGGFASYASTTPSGFGQGNSAFGATSPPAGQAQSQPEAKAPELTREISMGVDTQDPGFGGLSLGGSSSDTSSDASQTAGKGPVGMFGQAAVSQPSPASESTGFSSSGGLNPGFGAFSNSSWGQKKDESDKATTPVEASKPNPSPAFGQSGFGAKPAVAFGQSGFGQPSTFGKSTFGAPAAAAPTTPTAPAAGGFGAYANSFASFGSTSPSATPTKPVWATGKVETPPSKEPPKPVFLQESSASPIQATSDKTAESTPVKEEPKPSVFGNASTTPFGKPPASVFASEETKPSVFEGASTTPAGKPSASPFGDATSSPFKSSTPATPGGAFSNLKQASFGSSTSVFGQPDTNSPFFKATAEKPAVSAFGSPSPSSTTPAGASKPPVVSAFGSPSPLGSSVFGKSSVFGVPSTPSPAPQSSAVAQPTKGGFGAFSGSSSSPFGKSDSASGKSFSDLLKGAKKEEPAPKTPTSVFSLPSPTKEGDKAAAAESSTPRKVEEEEEEVKVFAVFSSTPPQKPKALPTTPPDTPGESDDGSRQDYSEDDEISFKGSSEEDDEQGDGSFASDTGSESFLDEGLSYEDVAAHFEEEDDIEGPHELSPVAEETSLLEESGDENNTSVQSLETLGKSPEPAKIPLPLSRSPSAAPGDLVIASTAESLSMLKSPLLSPADIPLPTTPSESVPGSPSDTPRGKPVQLPSVEPASAAKVEAASTTPPVSPAKLSPTLPLPNPTSPFGMGLSRPSARPARSSPLAGVPILGDGGSDKEFSAGPSSPSLLKPRPASPKTVFGQWGSSPGLEEESPEPAKKRPKTPPLSALAPPSGGSKPFTLPAFNVPPPLPTLSPPNATSLFGSKPVAPATPPAAAPPSLFGFKPPAAPQTPPGPPAASGSLFAPRPPSTPATSSLFGRKAPPPLTDTPPPASPFLSPATAFGQKPTTPPASSNLFGQKAPLTPPSPPVPVTQPKPPTPTTPIPEPSIQDGMQAECAYLFTSMNKELEDLKLFAQAVSRKREHLMKPKPVTGTKADVGDLSKWTMADIPAHGKAMKQLSQDTASLREIRDGFLRTVQEIESDMLRGTTRKEEIVRFGKATSTAEFSRMMKSRTLGPEHLETQTKLRRQMRNIRDRVEKLEVHLQISKKTLSRRKTGKVGFTPPSLDTVNRTYRNIDITIARQADDVSKLSSRMAKLDIKSFGKSSTSARDKRLPDKQGRKLNVTPSVAATTAAALNAERSAYKLKQVLLSVRDKPLLNDKAAHVKPSRVDFQTPQKPGAGWVNSSWQIPQIMPAPFTPPGESPTSNSGSRRGGGSKHHQKSAQLKRAPVDMLPSPSPAPIKAGFDWGPLPTVGTKPTASLPFSIR